MKLDPYLLPCTKLNSKWFKDLGIRPDNLYLPEEKVHSIVHHVDLETEFFNKTPKGKK